MSPAEASASEALAVIAEEEDRLDVLVHNAGILECGVVDGPTALRVVDADAAGIERVTGAVLGGERVPEDGARVVVRSATLGPDRRHSVKES